MEKWFSRNGQKTLDYMTSEREQIDADMAHAVTLEFGPYVGYLAGYGVTLRDMARQFTAPEIALVKLTAYADESLNRAREAVK